MADSLADNLADADVKTLRGNRGASFLSGDTATLSMAGARPVYACDGDRRRRQAVPAPEELIDKERARLASIRHPHRCKLRIAPFLYRARNPEGRSIATYWRFESIYTSTTVNMPNPVATTIVVNQSGNSSNRSPNLNRSTKKSRSPYTTAERFNGSTLCVSLGQYNDLL